MLLQDIAKHAEFHFPNFKQIISPGKKFFLSN